MGSLFIAILVLLVAVSFFYNKSNGVDNEQEKEKAVAAKLRLRYHNALKSGNKTLAAQCGRDYYAYLRNSRDLDAADEKAITHDLASMNDVK